jgi:hypothetical protein
MEENIEDLERFRIRKGSTASVTNEAVREIEKDHQAVYLSRINAGLQSC